MLGESFGGFKNERSCSMSVLLDLTHFALPPHILSRQYREPNPRLSRPRPPHGPAWHVPMPTSKAPKSPPVPAVPSPRMGSSWSTRALPIPPAAGVPLPATSQARVLRGNRPGRSRDRATARRRSPPPRALRARCPTKAGAHSHTRLA